MRTSSMRRGATAASFLACICVTSTAGAQIPVIPGIHGFGTDTVAGRGGRVIAVTTLADSGAGSLDACLRATGPRVCVFEVSGTIHMTHNLAIREPFVTVAGQTAPSPGILVRGAGLVILTHDVLVQHIRVRPGDAPEGPAGTNRDALSISNDAEPPTNIVIDHCSFSWSTDEAVSIWYESGDVAFRHLIISEPLHDSIHIDEGATVPAPHGFGPLWGTSHGRVSGYGSLLAHGVARQPMSIMAGFVWVNNVHYDRLQIFTHLHNRSGITSANSIVGNVYIEGPSLASWAFERPPITITNEFIAGSQLYVEDNSWSRMAVADPWELVRFDVLTRADIEATSAPVWPAGLVARPSSETLDWVLENAGARPLDRDPVDTRVVGEVRSGTGSVINCVSPDGSDRCMLNGGGWPVLAENHRALAVPADPNGDADGDGYTNVEEWLQDEAAALEPAGEVEEFVFSADPVFGDRRSFTEASPARWRVVSDQGDLRYAIVTSAYDGGPGSELGELAVVADRTYDDLELEVSVRSAEDATNTGPDADIVFGYEGPADYFYAMLNGGDGLTGLYRVSGGMREELATFAGAGIPDFEYHRYVLRHEAGRVIVSRDGETLLDVSGLDVPPGAVGIGSFNDAAFFDDLVVQSLEASEDAGTVARDGGTTPPADSGPARADAGSGPTTPAGCACRAAAPASSPLPAASLVLALGLALAARRRR